MNAPSHLLTSTLAIALCSSSMPLARAAPPGPKSKGKKPPPAYEIEKIQIPLNTPKNWDWGDLMSCAEKSPTHLCHETFAKRVTTRTYTKATVTASIWFADDTLFLNVTQGASDGLQQPWNDDAIHLVIGLGDKSYVYNHIKVPIFNDAGQFSTGAGLCQYADAGMIVKKAGGARDWTPVSLKECTFPADVRFAKSTSERHCNDCANTQHSYDAAITVYPFNAPSKVSRIALWFTEMYSDGGDSLSLLDATSSNTADDYLKDFKFPHYEASVSESDPPGFVFSDDVGVKPYPWGLAVPEGATCVDEKSSDYPVSTFVSNGQKIHGCNRRHPTAKFVCARVEEMCAINSTCLAREIRSCIRVYPQIKAPG